jgi:hypothetical protein
MNARVFAGLRIWQERLGQLLKKRTSRRDGCQRQRCDESVKSSACPWLRKDDAQIREDIKSQLWWSPFVDSEKITVSVDDGIATMKGNS